MTLSPTSSRGSSGGSSSAVVKDPTVSTDNVITPPANVRGLVVDATAGSNDQPPVLIKTATGVPYVLAASVGEWDVASVYAYFYLSDQADDTWSLNSPAGIRINSAVLFGGSDGDRANLFRALAASSQLAANQFSIYLDPTPGAAKLKIAAKDANGTTVTASIDLT